MRRRELLIDLIGVCEVSVGMEWQDAGFPKARGFVLRLRSIADVNVIREAPWWTPLRLAVALGVACSALIVALGATGIITAKNRRLRRAEGDLTAAKDRLARRVEVRTDQLQAQLAARRDEFSDYAAVTAERVRVARDLHDSLEQTLAGTALRLEAARDQMPEEAAASRSQLERAGALLRRSQAEVRRTVWGLRALALEKQSFAEALGESVHLLTDDTGIETSLEIESLVCGFDPSVEGELLRIAQEAVTNVLKHSESTRLELFFGNEDAGTVLLRIADDGVGFDVSLTHSDGEPHFGLQGMRERVASIGGKLEIISSPGGGTVVELRLPAPHLRPPQKP